MINVTKTFLPSLSEYKKYLILIWKKNWITNNGDLVRLLENKLEKYLGVKHIVLVSNGTIAMQLVIKSLELKGEVITTPFTFAATTNVLIWEGLTPVFADIDPQTYTIDPEDVERKITSKTSAILAVHVYGNPCHIEKLQKIAQKHKIKLIYDAAHSFGVKYKNESVLNFGDASTLSFHATKTFHTVEGGAIVVNSKRLAAKLKLLRNFGIASEESVVAAGINAKMSEFHAAMGLCNLKILKDTIKKREQIYKLYKENLGKSMKVQFQKIIASRYNYTYMPVVFKNKTTKNIVFSALVEKGIKPRKYFYPLITDFPYVKKSYGKYEVPNAKKISDSVLCLPIFPGLRAVDVEFITSTINKYI